MLLISRKVVVPVRARINVGAQSGERGRSTLDGFYDIEHGEFSCQISFRQGGECVKR
jgi:hypothetical protein